jgi:hypothetical protein
MTKRYTLKVCVRVQDNQDGGYSVIAYNSEDEMLADHPALEDLEDDDEIEEIKAAILGCEDEYENGYISEDTIEIEIGDDGVAKLFKPLTFHAGQ